LGEHNKGDRMNPIVRNALAVAIAWLLTFLAFAFAGYIQASSGPFGEVARDAATTGESGADVARRMAHEVPGFADDVWRALERAQRFMDWLYLPAVGAVLGLLLGGATRGRRLVPVVVGLLPFSALVLSSNVSVGSIHVAVAFGVAFAVLLWRRRHVP
jgi:hypothetical protein